MTTKTVELEMDAVAKLEAARWSAGESLSAVVRRATFTAKPHLARELLAREDAPGSQQGLDAVFVANG